MRGRFSSFSYIALFLLSWLVLTGCQDLGTPVKEKPPCPSIRTLPLSPYGVPIWHPSGNFLGFNYTPLERIEYPYGEHCQGRYFWKYDSMGFWLVNSDGTNMRRVCYPLDEPAWSPDGQWIAFVSGIQIFKMRFFGSGFDTTMPIQLTSQGNNFSPAWSPDGQWIVYDRPLADSSGSAGIWLMKPDGREKRPLFGAAIPTWHPNGQIVLGVVGTSPTSIWKRFLQYDVVQSTNLGTFDAVVGNDNRNPHYSPDGTKIAFSSKPSQGNGNIWLMNSDGSNLRQLTIEGSTTGLSWSPDGKKIAYVSYRFTDWSYANGTIWTIVVETGEQTQLTFNYPPTDIDV